MSVQAAKYLSRNGLVEGDIKYILRDGGKTVIHCVNSSLFDTYIPVKAFVEECTDGYFEIVNKGVALAVSQIARVDDHTCTMLDGMSFACRVNGKPPTVTAPIIGGDGSGRKSISERFSALDDLSIACFVVEVVFDSQGHGIDFVFRYYNKKMGNLEGNPRILRLNRSFYETFKNGNKQWLVTCVDVALYGTPHHFTVKGPKTGRLLTVRCFQPEEGYCACFVEPA